MVRKRRWLAWIVATILVLVAWSGDARAGSLDPDADFVFLLKDCAGGPDCFEDLAALDDWIWNTRQPTASSPLVVDIGPGDFVGQIGCPAGNGWVTFRGAGRDRSRIVSPEQFPLSVAVVAIGCEKLGFQDLAIVTDPQFALFGYAIFWVGAGSSSWTDVDVFAKTSAWYDVDCGGAPTDPPAGLHYFYGSKLTAGALGYFAECGQTWLYGSEILVEPRDGDVPVLLGRAGVWVSARGDVRLFGSTVRVTTRSLSSPAGAAVGVHVGRSGNTGTPEGYGEFHMHGGIVNVDASNLASVPATSLEVRRFGAGDAFAHTPGTAFVVRAGPGGKATRTAGDGKIQSPFLWQAGAEPPVLDLGSLTGQDVYVETDCSGSGCDAGGTDPHLMIYKADCPNSPWFDLVRQRCRD